MNEPIKFQVDPDGRFRKAVDQATRQVEDLRVPFGLIATSWLKSNKAIFALAGPGKYEDLSFNYKKAKQKKYGFVYPILKATGRLERSITEEGGAEAIQRIGKQVLFMGTSVPYAFYHQADGPRKKIPFRPVVLIGAESVAPAELNGRREIWIKIIEDYVVQKTKQSFGG